MIISNVVGSPSKAHDILVKDWQWLAVVSTCLRQKLVTDGVLHLSEPERQKGGTGGDTTEMGNRGKALMLSLRAGNKYCRMQEEKNTQCSQMRTWVA